MLRPPRSTKRFQGSASGTTSLSNPHTDADGTRMRRRYAFGAAACLLVLALIIALAVGGGKDEKNATSTNTPASKKGAYTAESHVRVDEVGSDVKVFKHNKSGMEIMTMVPDDTDQDGVFGLSFRTIPDNNHGTAHVVEHALLSGSKNYPVKDPFNQMMRGSMQTYMDSWTSRDRTVFEIASRNKVDFSNGIKVMLDSVFNPLIAENVWPFRQEGWRLEVDQKNALYLSGNAINEAKGASMQPQMAMINYLYSNLFAGHPYTYNARGNFRDIVSLTHGELVEFYTKFYHPSNGQAFCYGPQDFVDECMNLMDPVLSEYTADTNLREATKVPWLDLKKISSSEDKIPYPSYQDTVDFRYVQSWVLNDQPMDAVTELCWFLIHDLLVGSPTATLTRMISDLKLGDDVIGQLEYTLQQWVLILGATGIQDSVKVERTKAAISKKLAGIAEGGFADEAVTAALNKLELKLREQSSPDKPQGVNIWHKVLSHWTYGRDPKHGLKYLKAFEELKASIEKNGQKLLINLVTRQVMDNQHELSVELFPSTNVLDVLNQQEQIWLDNLENWVTKAEGMKMLQETKDLREIQSADDSEEALRIIPRMSISDLNKEPYEIPTHVEKDVFDSGITMLEHELAYTNGIVYVDFAIDISNMDFDDVVLLPLLCQLMEESGTERKSDVTFQREIDTNTGGITVFPVIEEVVQTNSEGSYVVPDGKHLVTKIVIRSSCLAEKGCLGMFNLIKHIMFDAQVQNQNKAVTILGRRIDDLEDDIQNNGHLYTTLRIASQFSLPGFVNEQWRGITQLLNMRRAVAQEAAGDWESISMRLLLMQDAMKRGNRNGMVLSVTGEKQAVKDVAGSIQLFVRDILPQATQTTKFPDFGVVEHPWVTRGTNRMQNELNAQSANEAFVVPTRVNHVGKGGILFDIGERIRGSDMVVVQFLSGYYLFEQLRFIRGALEAGAVLDIDSGSVIYQSDNDPNIVETLQVYEEGSSWLWGQVNGRQELPVEAQAAIVGAIAELDGTALQPSVVGYVAMVRYLKQDSPENRQLWRTQVLGSKVEDFMGMVDRLGAWGKTSVAVVTNKKQLERAAEAGFNMTTCDYTGYEC